mgnify:FL=1
MKKKIRTVIIVQARMSSTRLPGKILMKVMGKTLLEYQIERLRNVKNADEIVIATSNNSCDNEIVSLCNNIECCVYRGSEVDVLSRYYDAATYYKAECIVRINSDCPLIDHVVVDSLINHYLINFTNYDYVSNILERGYPIGLHAEVFSIESLADANKNAIDSDEREHVTPYIYRNKDIFNLKSISINTDLSDYRWTVDYPEDFKLVSNIIENLYPDNNDFNMYDILDYLRNNPKLIDINSWIKKNQTL